MTAPPPLRTLTRIAPGRYSVPSETVPGRSYSVQVKGDRGHCNCPGFPGAADNNNVCKHVRECIAEEGKYMDANNGATETAVAMRDNSDVAAIRPPVSALPSKSELAVMISISNSIYTTRGKLIPNEIDTPAAALAIMLAGNEYGIGPMASFREIYLVKGRTVPSYRVIVGMVLNGDPGARIKWIERTAERACVNLKRSNGMEIEVEYTWAMAKRANLTGSDFYQKYPEDALAKMAVVRACRLAGGDLITGIGASTKHAPAVMEAFEDDGEPLPELITPPPPPAQANVQQSPQRAAPPKANSTTPRPAPERSVKSQLALAVKELLDTTDVAFQRTVYPPMHERHPEAFAATGQFYPSKISDVDAAAELAYVREKMHGTGPSADAESAPAHTDDDAGEQGRLS